MDQVVFEVGGRAVSLAQALAGATVAALLVLVLVAVIALLGLSRRRRERAGLARQLAMLNQAQAELTGRMATMNEATASGQFELKRSVDQRLEQVSQRMGHNLAENAQRTGLSLAQLNERLAVIDTAQSNLANLSTQMVSLQHILANKQSRGAFGQGRMEAIVKDGLPRDSYSFQYTLSNGKRPDCVVTMPDSDQVVVIDAKFPLEGFTALREARDAAATTEARGRVRTDVAKHINDIATKYRVPGETQDTLIMFVPSESIYADIHEHFDDLIQKAYRARVIIVSPNMLMLAVQTMQVVMKDVHMRAQAGVIQQEVARLLQDVGRLRDRVGNLQKHFDLSSRDIEEIQTSAKKISNRSQRIESLDFEDAAPAVAKSKSAKPKLVAEK
ncbi:MAG: DNA recombination protein RmuC [Alphaproteobacteria bacterium]